MVTDYRAIMFVLVAGNRSWNQIRADLGVSKSTIDKASRVVRDHRLDARGIAGLSNAQLEELFPDNRRRNDAEFLAPDFKKVAERMVSGKRVTLKVAHAKYLEFPVGTGQRHYSYRQYCSLFEHYVDVHQLSAQLNHDPGDELMVDWSGDGMVVVDPVSGQRVTAHLFVASLPHSGMMHVSAWPDQKMRSWLLAHRAALEYFGGCPLRLIPDNALTATQQISCGLRGRIPVAEYSTFADFYQIGITAAKGYRPRYKANVEKAVDIAQQWCVEYLDDQEFYSFDMLNKALEDQSDFINDRRPFRGQDISRRQLFEDHEQQLLRPLPDRRWSWSRWKKSKVAMNYHIRIANHWYSVPWKLAGKFVDVQLFDDYLDVFYGGEIVASHRIAPANYGYSTLDEHVPDNHKDLNTQWNRQRLEDWAKSIGTATAQLIGQMFNARKVEAQAYSSVLGVLNLSKDYSRIELEQACGQLLSRKAVPSVNKVAQELKDLKQAAAQAYLPTDVPLSTAIDTTRAHRQQPTADTPDSVSHVRGAGAFAFTDKEWKV